MDYVFFVMRSAHMNIYRRIHGFIKERDFRVGLFIDICYNLVGTGHRVGRLRYVAPHVSYGTRPVLLPRTETNGIVRATPRRASFPRKMGFTAI